MRYVNTNLGGSFLHTLVSWSSAVIQEEGIFPMVVICLQDVPIICLIHPPHINSFLTRPGNHTALDKRNAFHIKIIMLFRLNIYKTNDQIMKWMKFYYRNNFRKILLIDQYLAFFLPIIFIYRNYNIHNSQITKHILKLFIFNFLFKNVIFISPFFPF